MPSELIPDPDFDDPAEWQEVNVHEGSSLVSGGALTLTDFRGRVIAPNAPTADAGDEFLYEIVIDSTDSVGLQAIQWGNTVLWTTAYGAGTFAGTATAVANDESLNIAIAFTAGNLVIDRISIKMAHVCNQIKDAVATLVTGLATTGANVFTSRYRVIQQSALPSLSVFATNEIVNLESGTLDAPMRQLGLRIQGTVESTSSLDDTLETILKEVEVALGADITIGGLAIGLDLSTWSKTCNDEGEKPVGIIDIDYLVHYRTPFGDPETVA